MPFGYIYKIEFPNGKHYIGLTSRSLKQRQREHKCSAQNDNTHCLYNALRKYDMVDAFELVEIDTADTQEELCEKEIGYILTYNSHYMDGNGYNMTYGGEGTTGYVYTEDVKQNMSETKKKYHEDNPEAGKEHGERMKKYYEETTEAREQMSEIKKKYHEDNPEAGKEHGERMKKYYENPEARKEHGERMKKYNKEHPEARKEHGERMKKYYEENPEARQNLLDAKGQNNPFDVFKDGTFIKTFTYQYEAREYLQKEHHITSTIKISEVLAGRRSSSAGFVFKYK